MVFSVNICGFFLKVSRTIKNRTERNQALELHVYIMFTINSACVIGVNLDFTPPKKSIKHITTDALLNLIV